MSLKIGIAGLGTVGAGVVEILRRNKDLLEKRTGKRIEITAVSARDKSKARGVDIDAAKWFDNAVDLASAPDVDVVVELIGGAEGIAKELCEKALSSGKYVVTANKALLAKHGVGLAAIAENSGVHLKLEAAVAGGIPLIKALREGLSANRISRIAGILNGTCNYILTTMEKSGRDFADVLKEAQDKGYAEADPTFDVDGIDTAHKLAILTALAFGVKPDMDAVFTSGIRRISAHDIEYAKNLGFKIKLLGIAREIGGKVAQTVYPVMVRVDSAMAAVDGAFNAAEIEGDAVGRIVLEGPGAGRGATASAVVADIADIARGNPVWPFGVKTADLRDFPAYNVDELESEFYLRLVVIDKPGVVADITGIMRDYSISLESIIQRARNPGEPVQLVMVTHFNKEKAMREALAKIAKLDSVVEEPHMVRIVG